jgi:hypothetical protein
MAPIYKQKLKRLKITEKKIKKWDSNTVEQLQGCFASTNWGVFLTDNPSINELTEIITDYISYCEDMIVPVKTCKTYPNSKPWITTELRSLIKEKHKLRLSQNMLEMKKVQKELDSMIDKSKRDYKTKLEKQFQSNNTKAAWDGLKTITGYIKKKSPMAGDNNWLMS